MDPKDAEAVAVLAAGIYAGRDWHRLSEEEKALVRMLEKTGHLIPNNTADGFVGRKR